jgi:hypothetical protein
MGQLALSKSSNWISSRPRIRPRKSWPTPKGGNLTLSPVSPNEGASQWPPMGEQQCKTETVDISPGYKRAIALLRSLRNASEEEAQRQRESWELLKQDLDESKYH